MKFTLQHTPGTVFPTYPGVPTGWFQVLAILKDLRRMCTVGLRPRPDCTEPILVRVDVAFWGTCHSNERRDTTVGCDLCYLALFYKDEV